MNFARYDTGEFYDEMLLGDGGARFGARVLKERIESLPDGELLLRQEAAERLLLQSGITFNVYGDSAATEKIFPFDVIPRIIEASEWDWIEKGLKQRVYALNLFIDDIYHEQKIVRDKVVPEYLIRSARSFREACVGLDPPQRIWCHITGTDLVRDRDGQIYVLEDNLRCPSGVSYVLENRRVMKRTFPQVFEASRVRPVDEYPSRLLFMLQSLFPAALESPKVAVLTPGIYNSAYFEHAFLAQQMGVDLVEGSDLAIVNGQVMMRTTKGFERVDVLYRRIDDDFLDPQVFSIRLVVGRSRSHGRLQKRARCVGQCAGHGHCGRQVYLCLCAQDHRILLGRKDNHSQRTDLYLRRGRRSLLCRFTFARAGGKGGERIRRLRHVGRPALHGSRARGVRTADSR